MASSQDASSSVPANGRTTDASKPSNEYVLNVAFFSFLGFVMVQAVFAVIARSEAMLADSEAMMVDALTYLFNLIAERIKNQPLTDGERCLTPPVLHHQRELRRLYLELIPPSISVLTLLAVTCLTFREASETLRNASEEGEEQGEGDAVVSLPIMLCFSAANLLLDIVNVSCFARANLNFGLATVRSEQFTINDSLFGSNANSHDAESRGPDSGQNQGAGLAAEVTPLLATAAPTSNGRASHRRRISSSDLYQPSKTHEIVNLNMCSAWTHICADTLRSAAVLVAAAIAVLVPSIRPASADAVAAIVVSVIIVGSLIPLLQGLVMTAIEIVSLSRNPPPGESESAVGTP